MAAKRFLPISDFTAVERMNAPKSTGYNPYAAPAVSELPERTHGTRSVNWFLWVTAAVVFEVGLTATCLYKGISGQKCAIVSGIALAIAVIVASRKYSRWNALILAQFLNLCVWGSMLLTVWLMLPSVKGSGLSSNDVEIFAKIWCGGAVVVTLLTLVFGFRRGSNDEPHLGLNPIRDSVD